MGGYPGFGRWVMAESAWNWPCSSRFVSIIYRTLRTKRIVWQSSRGGLLFSFLFFAAAANAKKGSPKHPATVKATK